MERRLAIIVAAVLGLLAVLLTNVYLRQKETRQRQEEVQVLVATKDIAEGEAIGYMMLDYKAVPKSFAQPGALNSKEGAVGKVALVNIMAGEQVLFTKLAAPGSGLTLAVKTPPNHRAVTIGLDAAAAVGGMVKPGDHVDVIAIFSNPPFTITLFQDVLVLAVGQEMVATEEARGRRREEEVISASRRESVTLSLSPQEVQVILVAMEQGKIRLTLRSQSEKGESLPSVDLSNLPVAVDLSTLLQFYIKAPKPPPSVEVIRGLQKEMTPIPVK